jgi:hypothetical protein
VYLVVTISKELTDNTPHNSGSDFIFIIDGRIRIVPRGSCKENKDILTKNAQRFGQDKIVKRMTET